jgi:hypothetical protein
MHLGNWSSGLHSPSCSDVLEEDAKTGIYASETHTKMGAVRNYNQMSRRSQNAIPAKHFGTHEDQSRLIITLPQAATTWLILG